MSKSPNSTEVWSWPEFQALAERLGIDLVAKTTRLVITIDVGTPVKVEQEYYAEDMSQYKVEETDQ